jgi:hypothetical protein
MTEIGANPSIFGQSDSRSQTPAFARRPGVWNNFLSTTAPLWTRNEAIFGLRMKVIGYARVSTAEQASGGISLFVGPNTVEVAGKTLPSAWPSVREMAGVVTLTRIPYPVSLQK